MREVLLPIMSYILYFFSILLTRVTISFFMEDFNFFPLLNFSLKWTLLIVSPLFIIDLMVSFIICFRHKLKFKLVINKYSMIIVSSFSLILCAIFSEIEAGLILMFLIILTEKGRALFVNFFEKNK